MTRLGKVRVLVAEDDRRSVELAEQCLRDHFDVVSVHAGQSALAELIGISPSMRSLFATIEQAARSSEHLLISGEEGTGRTLVARALFQQAASLEESTLVAEDFLVIDLHKLHESQWESTLLPGGHLPSCKYLAVDGIELISSDLQSKLWATITESSTLPRFITITTPALVQRLSSGEFHPELWSMLSSLSIEIPALRERGEDIPHLAIHFAQLAAESLGKSGIRIGRETMAELCSHDWPENVKELKQLMHQAVMDIESNESIAPGILSKERQSMIRGVVQNIIGGGRGLDAAMAELEAAVIREALEENKGNRSAAARQLKLPRQTLQDRMKKHGLWPS